MVVVLGFTWALTAWIFVDPETRSKMFVMGMLIPAPVALIISAIQHRSLKHIIRPIVGRFRASAYLFSVWYPLAFIGTCAVVAWLTGLAEFHGDRLDRLAYVPAPLDLLMGSVLMFGEEYGWRGYLLPELARRRGPIAATIIVGIVWAFFHGPVVYGLAGFLGTGNPALICATQMIAVFVFSFPFAYVFFKTGSILPAMIFHYVWNMYNPIVLGNIYRNIPGIMEGNILYINGEAIMGVVLGGLFVVWFIRKRQALAERVSLV